MNRNDGEDEWFKEGKEELQINVEKSALDTAVDH